MKTMAKSFILLLLAGLTLSCDKKDENTDTELIGKWKLIEIVADPGDGSGRFFTVESRKTLEFHSDGKITSNGSICEMSIEANFPSEGTFSLTDSTINAIDCELISPFKVRFSHEGRFLFIYFPCVEACIEKYIKE